MLRAKPRMIPERTSFVVLAIETLSLGLLFTALWLVVPLLWQLIQPLL